ncbi:hypothetical protein JOQ06_028394, partial [Pogonophryne albipinna]
PPVPHGASETPPSHQGPRLSCVPAHRHQLLSLLPDCCCCPTVIVLQLFPVCPLLSVL